MLGLRTTSGVTIRTPPTAAANGQQRRHLTWDLQAIQVLPARLSQKRRITAIERQHDNEHGGRPSTCDHHRTVFAADRAIIGADRAIIAVKKRLCRSRAAAGSISVSP